MKLKEMFINPVISKELRLRMRSGRTPWIITLYLLALGLFIFAYIYLETGPGYFNPNNSKTLFILMSFIQFALISLVTPGLTSGVISGEREKQTLNILLTTNLSPTKIILGKWFSSLSFMIFLILASLPLYSVVFLFGGISPTQLIEVFGFYIVSMLAIGSFGVLFSTIIKRTGISTIITFVTIIAYTVLTAIIPQMIQSYYYSQTRIGPYRSPAIIDWIYSINPFTSMLNIFESTSQINTLPIDPYWVFIIFFMLVTVIALGISIYFIRPVRTFRLFKG